MTAIHCASDLVEEAVFLYMQEQADAVDVLLWQGQRDALYGTTTPRERDGAFQSQARLWFERLALARPIEQALRTFPRVRAGVERVDVRRVLRARQEGSEVFGSQDPTAGGARRLVLGLVPARFLDPEALEELALRELCYADDLLDPAFGFDPRRADAEADPARRELARDRFKVLWRARIDGRLHRRRGSTSAPSSADPGFHAAFGGTSDPRAVDNLFRRAWSGELATYPQLLDHATHGAAADPLASTHA